jgi:hypothetical protein
MVLNWVTVICSAGSGACLTLALIQLFVWWKDRGARANLVFAVLAIAVATPAALESLLMRAQTPEQVGIVVRWLHVPAWVITISLVIFVRLYLKAARSSGCTRCSERVALAAEAAQLALMIDQYRAARGSLCFLLPVKEGMKK